MPRFGRPDEGRLARRRGMFAMFRFRGFDEGHLGRLVGFILPAALAAAHRGRAAEQDQTKRCAAGDRQRVVRIDRRAGRNLLRSLIDRRHRHRPGRDRHGARCDLGSGISRNGHGDGCGWRGCRSNRRSRAVDRVTDRVADVERRTVEAAFGLAGAVPLVAVVVGSAGAGSGASGSAAGATGSGAGSTIGAGVPVSWASNGVDEKARTAAIAVMALRVCSRCWVMHNQPATAD